MNDNVNSPAEASAPRRYDHHRLDAYNVAVEFVRWRAGALKRLPRGSDLADQITRAASSIVLNIAEGCGEYSPRDRVRFFRMARRSATECDAVLDVVEAMQLESGPRLAAGRALLSRVIAMLTILCRSSSPT